MPKKGQVSHGKKVLALIQKCPCELCEEYRERRKEQKRASYHRCEKPDRSEYNKAYYAENKEYYQKYYQENREQYLSHYYENREHHLQRFREDYQNNREHYDAKKRKRRAVQEQALGEWNITEAEHVEILQEIQKGHCFYCGILYGNAFHREHKTPLSRGGLHAPENIVLSCATCNLSKGNKTEEEFYAFRSDTKTPA